MGQHVSDVIDALDDEVRRAVGIVDVAGPVEHVEHLAGLRDRAQQGVVAAVAFALLVVADRRPLRVPPSALHGAVEVQRDGGQVELGEAVENQLSHQGPEPVHAAVGGRAQGPRDGGHVGQP